MKTGDFRSCSRRAAGRRHGLLLLLGCLLPGCTATTHTVEKQLRTSILPEQQAETAASYLAAFPDVLDINVPGRPDLTGRYTVGLDGRIQIGSPERLRVEGLPAPEIARLVAIAAGLSTDRVHVQVAEYRSQPLFLLGQVAGWQRTIPYHGQETVLEVLQRGGGITKGAAPEDVYLVRAHVGDARKPEVFHVNLHAIVIDHEEKTNIRVLPYDQIYVGESRQAKVLKCVPPFLKPMLLAIWGPLQSRPDARSLRLRRGAHAHGDVDGRAGGP